MRIVVLCEGKTEEMLRRGLREFVQQRATGRRVGIQTRGLDGPTLRKKLARLVTLHLARADTAGLVVLTDVYAHFKIADEAKGKLAGIVGRPANSQKFRVYVAQYEVEAWLVPFWTEIAKSLGVNMKRPGANPEEINDQKPPSHHLGELFRRAKDRYEKVTDGPKWLTAERLAFASKFCPELKLFLSSLLQMGGAGGPP